MSIDDSTSSRVVGVVCSLRRRFCCCIRKLWFASRSGSFLASDVLVAYDAEAKSTQPQATASRRLVLGSMVTSCLLFFQSSCCFLRSLVGLPLPTTSTIPPQVFLLTVNLSSRERTEVQRQRERQPTGGSIWMEPEESSSHRHEVVPILADNRRLRHTRKSGKCGDAGARS
jgi:hypothetical protein